MASKTSTTGQQNTESGTGDIHFYKALAESAHDFFYLIDRNLCISYVNNAGARLFGGVPGEIVGKPVSELFPGETSRRQQENIRKVFKSGREVYIESQYRIMDSEYWLSARLTPVRDRAGDITHVLGISRDISKNKIAEQALVEQHENFNTILERFPEYLYVADVENHEVLFANRGLRDLTGRPIVGGKCHREFHGREEPCDFCTNELILKTGMPHVWENYNEHLGRHFLLTDQIISWPDGRDVRFEVAVDITDRKKIEKILEASEEKYRTFIEQSSYGFFVLDPGGYVSYLNERAQEIIGTRLEGREPVHFSRFISPEDYEKATMNLGEMVRGKKFDSARTYRFLHTDGETRIVEVQTLPIWRNDELAGFHGTLVDITSRVKSQEELNRKSEFLDAVVTNSFDGIFVIDEDFKYVFINPASGRIMGHEPEEWIGKRAGTNRHLDDEKKSQEAVFKALNGEPSSCEIRVKHTSGEYRLLEIRYSLLMMDQEPHILGMVNDITERKETENAIMASEEKYRSLFENSPEAVFILDTGGIIMECNAAATGLTGLKNDELVGKGLHELCILDDRQAARYSSLLESMSQGRELDNHELELMMKDGDSRWVEILPSLISRDREIHAIQLIFRDISERKSAELEMRRKLMRFDLENGNVYLTREPRANQSIAAFKELLMVGYSGIMISRQSRKDFQDMNRYGFNHIRVSEKDMANHLQPDYRIIHDYLSGLPRGEVLHIDCIGYLVSRLGSTNTIKLVQYLNDLAMARNLIVLISVDPAALSERDLRMIEMESRSIAQTQSAIRLSPKLLDILLFIEESNRKNNMPSYSRVGEYLRLSKPTARARIRQLLELEAVREIQRGRMKTLELTDKGRNHLIIQGRDV